MSNGEVLTTPTTPLSRDVVGRYMCNTFEEAKETWEGPDSPGFDAIVIGGGTFGAALAANLYFRSETFVPGNPFAPRNYRVLLLEAGPYVLPEHGQNLPRLELFDPSPPTSIAKQRAEQPDPSLPIPARNEVWGLAWHSPEPFTGLAYCLGGRSLYWGGWSPWFLDSEMPTAGNSANLWPAAVVEDLKGRFFAEANRQLGADEANDFIKGELHGAMRAQLLQALQDSSVEGAIPLSGLEPQVVDDDLSVQQRVLEAPYAVSTSARAGFFPANKFSSVPLLMAAARDAFSKSGADNNRKRLMVVPNCHVTRLDTEETASATGATLLRVKGIETNRGYVPIRHDVEKQGVVVLAAAAIESTRLALLSFEDRLPNQQRGLAGTNLMAHTRANLLLRIPREKLLELVGLDELPRLEVSALQVRCRHLFEDGTVGHYHIQVTASGSPNEDFNADRELFQKVPDLDHYQHFVETDLDKYVPIALRGIAEMEPRNAGSQVSLDSERDEYGQRRAFAAFNGQSGQTPVNQFAMGMLSTRDHQVFEAMKQTMVQVATVFDPGFSPPPFKCPRETGDDRFFCDALGTTHHEAGTLWMGDDAEESVTNPDGRFHCVTNAFVADLSVLPTSGSANPMLPGIALARRLAKHLVPEGDGRFDGDSQPPKEAVQPLEVALSELPAAEEDFRLLFDGHTSRHWRMAGKGQFFVMEGALQGMPGNDLGLYWCTVPTPPDFTLRLDWLIAPADGQTVFVENAGVFVRFPHPDSKAYQNPAYVPVDHGFEIQIDPTGRGPEGQPDFQTARTGAVYGFSGPETAPDAPPGLWNQFEIRVQGQNYRILVNGQQTVDFTYTGDDRGLASTTAQPTYIGLQAYGGAKAAFRNIRIKAV